MPSPEHAPHNTETAGEKLVPIERTPEIKDRKTETAGEESRETVEKNIEQAKAEANKEAISGREVSAGEKKQRAEDTAPVAQNRKESYKHTMRQIQGEMSAPARAFSKIIHNPVVERVSDVVGGTVARPDAILSGSIFAFLLVLGLYLLARQNGFALSGFETIATFIIGWILGIVFDFLRAMITGKRQ